MFHLILKSYKTRRSCPDVFYKKDVLRNFAKFTEKHLCQSLFFNKVAGLRPATLLKKRLCHRCFPVNFVKFLRTSFCIEYLWSLLLQNDILFHLLFSLIADFALYDFNVLHFIEIIDIL